MTEIGQAANKLVDAGVAMLPLVGIITTVAFAVVVTVLLIMLATNAALQAQFDKKIEKALKTAKSKWDKDQAPNAEAAQKLETFMATMNARAIAAEVKSTGADYGLVNVDAALKLMDNSKIKVADDGTVTGVKEALDALKTTMPFLFGATQKPGAMAQRVSGAAPSTLTGVEASFYAKNPGLKKPE